MHSTAIELLCYAARAYMYIQATALVTHAAKLCNQSLEVVIQCRPRFVQVDLRTLLVLALPKLSGQFALLVETTSK